jgi:hypothetical protein
VKLRPYISRPGAGVRQGKGCACAADGAEVDSRQLTNLIMVFLHVPIDDLTLQWIELAKDSDTMQLKQFVQMRYSIPIDEQRLVSNGGFQLTDEERIGNDECIHVLLRLPGGKGGFGTNLRALGGKMSKKKTLNKDSCRDINGRRIRTVKEAEKKDQHETQRIEWEKQQSEKREKKIKDGLKEPEVKKVLFDDTEYLEAHEKAREDVKDAVQRGLYS